MSQHDQLMTDPDLNAKPWCMSAAAAVLLVGPATPALLQAWRSVRGQVEPELLANTYPPLIYLAVLAMVAAALVRQRWLLALVVPAALLAPLELAYLAVFGLPSGSHVYGVIADTHAEEVSSFVGPWWWGLALGGVLVVSLVAWAARQWWRADLRWQHRSRIWVLAAGAAGVLAWAAMEATTPTLDVDPPLTSHPHLQYWLTDADGGLAPKFEAVFPWGLPMRWWRYHEHRQALADHARAVANFDFGVQGAAAAAPDDRQIQVMVIGETGRPDRWGLFGAARATTPLLSHRDNLLVFKDAVSAASATRESVSLMLTRRPPASPLASVAEPSLVTAFKQAGYKTYWLSNQGSAGAHETPVSVLAHEAHEHQFFNAVDYKGAGTYDGVLLPALQQILKRHESRQLIVLHTLGSHLHYAHRYPPAFEQFKPALSASDKPDIWHNSRLPELINAYDNSVLYTDWLLDQVITQLVATGARATMVYSADHGETFFDGQCPRGGHGFAANVNYRVPLLMWLSPTWQASRPEATAALRSAQDRPVSTLALFSTLTGMAGFRIVQPHAHGDLSQPGWQPSRRLVTHYGDFDGGFQALACDKPALPTPPTRAN
jgi:glucan phosphoethanolaminetransferase (alkaline phosphatase superfamily)